MLTNFLRSMQFEVLLENRQQATIEQHWKIRKIYIFQNHLQFPHLIFKTKHLFSSFQSHKQLYNHKCPLVHQSVCFFCPLSSFILQLLSFSACFFVISITLLLKIEFIFCKLYIWYFNQKIWFKSWRIHLEFKFILLYSKLKACGH